MESLFLQSNSLLDGCPISRLWVGWRRVGHLLDTDECSPGRKKQKHQSAEALDGGSTGRNVNRSIHNSPRLCDVFFRCNSTMSCSCAKIE